jgi:multicomponent Na+:H+ antiporter subunit G
MIREIISALFLIAGAFFMFVAALGMLRFPDLYTRMHAASKSISLGIGCLLVGVIFHFVTFLIILKSIAIVLFIFMTMPVASHMISRVAYLRKVQIWDKTGLNEMRLGNTSPKQKYKVNDETNKDKDTAPLKE